MSDITVAPPRAPNTPPTLRAPSAVVERRHMVIYLSARPLLTTPDRMAWRHFTWFIYYIQLLFLDTDYRRELLNNYNMDIPEVPPGLCYLFRQTREFLPATRNIWEVYDMFESMIELAAPGQFIIQAFMDSYQCLYYVAPLHFYYPWVDILVRDYTHATTQDGGFYKVVRLNMTTTNWIVRPQVNGRIWVEYIIFRILYFFLRHWHTVPRLGRFHARIQFNDVEDNIV